MIMYRPHRGGLAEAMAEAKEFETEEDMKRYIYEEHKALNLELGVSNAPFEIEDIELKTETTCRDDRIGWNDSTYVCVKRYGNEDYVKKYGASQCLGFCATDYERNKVEV